MIWNIFLSEDDTADELTDDEKKEILKLHKYFAHRNARKLWDKLLSLGFHLDIIKLLV